MCNNNEKSDILSLQLPNKISRVRITSRETYNPHHHKEFKIVTLWRTWTQEEHVTMRIFTF